MIIVKITRFSNFKIINMELQVLNQPLILKSESKVVEREVADRASLLLIVAASFIYIGNLYTLGVAAKDYSVFLDMPESFSGTLTGVN